VEIFPPWDGVEDLDRYRMRMRHHEKQQRIERLKRTKMAQAVDQDGNPLYKISSGGNLRRARKIPARVREFVLERDQHACTECGASDFLELHHIVRYIDGGPDTPANLQTLCTTCHGKKGGMACESGRSSPSSGDQRTSAT